MNASQRRIARRAIAAAFPVGLALVTPMGAQATVKGHTPAEVLVQYRNGRRAGFRPSELLAA